MLETAGGESVDWSWRETSTADGRMFVETKLDSGMSNREVNDGAKRVVTYQQTCTADGWINGSR